MHKVKIITTDKTLLEWNSLESKKTAILTALNSAQNANFELEIHYANLSPVVKDGRIDHQWFDTISRPSYAAGYDFVHLHFSKAQKESWGITGVRGIAIHDRDYVHESYSWADENTLRNGYNQFIETTLHELRHLICQESKITDDTHELHAKHGTITKQFKQIDMGKFQASIKTTKSYLSLLVQLVQLLTGKKNTKKYTLPLPNHWHLVTQEYFNPDPIRYPKWGLHLGTDFAAPEGTPILAPADGEIVDTGYSDSLGYYVQFKHDNFYLVALHLNAKQTPRSVKSGQPIGFVGRTGKIDGVHAHLECWTTMRDINLDPRIYTKNPLVVYSV